MYAPPALPSPPAGWYPDPDSPSAWRWWNGERWTEHSHAPEHEASAEPLPGPSTFAARNIWPAAAEAAAAASAAAVTPEPSAAVAPESSAAVAPEPSAAVAPEPAAAIAPEPAAAVAPEAAALEPESLPRASTATLWPAAAQPLPAAAPEPAPAAPEREAASFAFTARAATDPAPPAREHSPIVASTHVEPALADPVNPPLAAAVAEPEPLPAAVAEPEPLPAVSDADVEPVAAPSADAAGAATAHTPAARRNRRRLLIAAPVVALAAAAALTAGGGPDTARPPASTERPPAADKTGLEGLAVRSPGDGEAVKAQLDEAFTRVIARSTGPGYTHTVDCYKLMPDEYTCTGVSTLRDNESVLEQRVVYVTVDPRTGKLRPRSKL